MATNTANTRPDMFVLTVPKTDVNFFKTMAKKMGWTIERKRLARTKSKPRLYDPETGEYLHDETMQAIEDVRSGKDKGITYASFEEFEKAMRAL